MDKFKLEKQQITYVDEDGVEKTYSLPVKDFDWKKIHLSDQVKLVAETIIYPKEELDKRFGFGGKYGEFKQYQGEQDDIDSALGIDGVEQSEKHGLIDKVGNFIQ
jgi:hypothetical protein